MTETADIVTITIGKSGFNVPKSVAEDLSGALADALKEMAED